VSLLDAIPEPFRTAVFLDGASGLRVGELLGLKWEDVFRAQQRDPYQTLGRRCLVFAKGKRSSLMDPYWTLGEDGTLCK
jgi:integrase